MDYFGFVAFDTVQNATQFCQKNGENPLGLYSPTLDDYPRLKMIMLNNDFNPAQKSKYWWTGFMRYNNGI